HWGRCRALRLATANEDEHVERVEELADLLRERRSARDAAPQATAELLLHLRVHEPVGEPVLERKAAAQALAALARHARAAPDAERPVRDSAPRAAQLVEVPGDRRVDLLVHARHAGEDGRAH